MYKFVAISLVIVLSLDCCCGWFTDINYNMLVENNYDDDDGQYNIIADRKQPSRRINMIVPGTKWCGSGNVAINNEDLGYSKEADMCCRAHDNCEDTIAGGGTKHNLENDASYTRLSCSCDLEFQKCLLSADTAMSEFIGMTYFDGLQTKCFKKEYPITKCLQYGGWFNEKCLEYELDESGTPTYQWFDVPMFGK